jgi:O-antigen/teichoic acid export membrane protein
VISTIQSLVAKVEAATLPAGSVRTRFVKGMFWMLVGTVLSQGLQLLATIFVARWLGKSEYGELGVVRSTIGMFGVFVGLGLGLTATKYVSEFRIVDPIRAGRVAALTLTVALVSGFVVTLVLVALAPWMAVHTLASAHVAVPLAIASGLLFFGELNGVQIGILSGLEAFRAIARVTLWAGVCSFPIIISFTWLWGINGAVAGLVASLALNCLLNNLAVRRESAGVGIRMSYQGSWKEKAVLWKFSAPAFLSNAMVAPTAWICNAMLVNHPGGYAEMGLFSAADQWRNVLLFLPGIMSRVMLPILSNHSNEPVDGTSRFSKMLEAGFSAAVVVVFPLVTVLAFGSGLITKAYGKDFVGMGHPLVGLLCAGGILALATPSGLALQAKGAMWLGFAINLLWAVLLLGFFHLLRGHGALGLAAAYALAYFCFTMVALWYVCRAGYYPWRLGARTYLACIVLLLFAAPPLLISPGASLRLSPLAGILSLGTLSMLIPSRVFALLRHQAAVLLQPAGLRLGREAQPSVE